MHIGPQIGKAAGQQYDVARAIRTFLGQMAEGGINIAAAVIKELLQNADDAGATEVHVVLDERASGDGIPLEYGPLLAPALLVRNNAPFRLRSDVEPDEKDDFTAICDVASGHKRFQATAAGRFGIGFNSVYFLTDTPVLFSRREVHIFDLLHRIFPKETNGWRFSLDEFPAEAGSGAGVIKMVLERAIPKAVLGLDRTFGQLAGDGGDYQQAILRLPLRMACDGGPGLYPDRFAAPADRLAAIEAMAQQAARSVLFLKKIEKVSFGRLDGTEIRQIAQVTITPPTPEFADFVKSVAQAASELVLGDRLTCECQRTIRFVQWEDGTEKSNTDWSFYLKHGARFDDAELLNLRQWLNQNDEKAIPWASLAVPLDRQSLQMDGTEVPFWRVFLPLLEPGPCACLVNAALFVGPSRQRVEFRLEGSDEAKRKTQWNRQLIAHGVVPLMHDASQELLDVVPGLIQSHPKEYLSLFPITTDAESPQSLSAYLQEQFAQEAWCLRVYDIWQRPIDILVGDENSSLVLDMVPEWAAKYGYAFEHLSTERRRFIPRALGDAIGKRLGKEVAINVNRWIVSDVAGAILGHTSPPKADDLAPLLQAILRDPKLPLTHLLAGLWAFRDSRDGELLRYDAETLYVVDHPDQKSQIHQHLSRMGIQFAATEWVSPDVGLVRVNQELTRAFENVRPADDTTAIELLERVAENQGHDSVARAEAITPVVDFLLDVEPVRLSQNMRLAFLVKTASTAHDRREMGALLLKPEPASQEDNAVWEAFLRRAFAQVDSAFARELRRLIHRHPHLLPTLAFDECAVAIASVENSIDILHAARIRCPARFARLVDIINAPGNGKDAVQASLAILEIADRRWEELTDEQRTTILALPIHRLSGGDFVSLCDATGVGAENVREHFRLQSEDDIRDAPLSLPECQLLHSGSRLPARFYRRTLGLEEHGRAAVLKDSFRQIGGSQSNRKLLQYLAKHYGETIGQLSESDEPGNSEDLSELRRLFAEAKLVPCLDDKWRSVGECVDGVEVAEHLQRRGGWERKTLPAIVKELYLGTHIATFEPEARQLLQNLGCKLETLESRLVAQHAISSESPRLSLFERVKLLVHSPAEISEEVTRAAILEDVSIPALSGKAKLGSVELVDAQGQILPIQVLRHIAPLAVNIATLSQEWELPARKVEEALRALRIPVADVNAIHERLTNGFAQVWDQLDDQGRLSLLAYVAQCSNLEQSLSTQLTTLPTVLVGAKSKEWKTPDQVMAPKWLTTKPPHLLPERIPAVGGVSDPVVELWNRCCGINSLDAVLLTLVQAVQTHRSDIWKSDAKALYAWLDRLSSPDDVDDRAFVNALQKGTWVLARKGTDLRFLAPTQVIMHDGADVLSQRFWVDACPLPRCVSQSPERFGFATSPSATIENLRAIADCVQSSTVSDGAALCSVYQLILDMVSDDEHLKDLWLRIAREQPVYHLFRANHGPVSQLEVFLGNDQSADDYGNVLFCLKAAHQPPKGLVKTYRALGVEDCPTPEQSLFALCRITGSHKILRTTYRGLVDILLSESTDPVPGPEFRVPACSGTYEPVGHCFWSDGFGHSKRITTPSRKYLIDVDDASARRLMDWSTARGTKAISRLESVARRELTRAPDVIADNPAAQQVLGPWRDLLAEVHRDGSILQDSLIQAGTELPAQRIEISLARGILVRYVLPDGTIIEQDGNWEGLPVVHDGDRSILVADTVGARDYIGAADDLEVLHQAIADEVVALLRHDSRAEPHSPLSQELLEHLDRPTVTLERMRQEYQEHFFHQYHDQVADPEFAPLFEEFRKTRRGTLRQEQLQQEMQRILNAQYVNARREQIRGYGYDTFSVFAELLQNAEDAYLQRRRLGMDVLPQQTVSFRYFQHTNNGCELVVEHSGRQFNYWRHGERQDPNYSRDVEGVLRSAGSFKPHGGSQVEGEGPIGRFGLGFKSVYLITDRPRIHSGLWHFAIEASCLPVAISPPTGLKPEVTRLELPLRDSTQEFRDETGSQLLNLVPFLREVHQLTLRNSDGSSRELRVSVEHHTELGDNMTAERVAISGVDHVRSGIVRFLRLRHARHAGQIGVYLAEDGQPSSWQEAFTRDMYVSLPLSATLGCGIAASHRFEIQSGRTHLIPSEGNADRVEELACLLRLLPDGIAACTGSDITRAQFVNRFWGIWQWASGDGECEDLRRRLAGELVTIPQQQPFVPTLDGQTCVSFEQGSVFYFDGIPERVREAIFDAGLVIATSPNNATVADRVAFAADGFVQAYQRTCRFAGTPVSSNLVRVDWQVIGASCQEQSCLADCPELLNAIAESSPNWRDEQVLEWLPKCVVRGRDWRGQEMKAPPSDLTAPNFAGVDLLPPRFLKVLDISYSQAAVDILRRAGLLGRPTASQFCDWIAEKDLTQEEGNAILRYLAGDRRFMDAEYREMEGTFTSPWFPFGGLRLSSADAFAKALIPEDLLRDPLFSSWLGVSKTSPLPPPVRDRLREGETTEWLNTLFDWWQKNGEDWTSGYEQRVYRHGTPYAVSADFRPNELRDRQEWLCLFLTGALHTMGGHQPSQHAGFLRLCERKGWLDIFAAPLINAADWMRVLEEYLEENPEQLLYYHWMTQFVRIYHLARWLPEYVDSFRAIAAFDETPDFTQILTPRAAPWAQGGGPDAPPINRTLGIGACFVVRELTRRQVLTTPVIWPWCFVPSTSVRKVLWIAGCDDVAANECRGVTGSPIIHDFLEHHLGSERATFLGAFDLPLLAVSEGAGPAGALPHSLRATEMFNGR